MKGNFLEAHGSHPQSSLENKGGKSSKTVGSGEEAGLRGVGNT